MALTQDQFFQAVASRQIPRVRIAGINVNDGKVLVQKPADDPSSCYAIRTRFEGKIVSLAPVHARWQRSGLQTRLPQDGS